MTGQGPSRRALIARLAEAGCVAPQEEADELTEAAGGDAGRLRSLADRRVAGEPLAWVTGTIVLAGETLRVWPGVYVPRYQTEVLAARAVELLPPEGLAVDLCTGCGAVAAVLGRARPDARVVATDVDPVACACARANGVEVFEGDLDGPVPAGLRGQVDIVTAVVPYVPTADLVYLPRDVRQHEPPAALDGGPGGTRVLERAVGAGARLLHPGGTLLLEVGGHQDRALAAVLAARGFAPARRIEDEDGDLRAVEAVLGGPPAS